MPDDELIASKIWLAVKILLVLLAFFLLWLVQTAGQKAIEPNLVPVAGIIMLRRLSK